MATTLREGARGEDVAALQQQLQVHGFPPGKVDGVFGGGTKAAIIAFQKSEGIDATGIADQPTLDALGSVPEEPPLAIPAFTVAIAAKMFPEVHLGTIKAHLPRVLDAMAAANLKDNPIVLCALATIRAETAGFVPISEFISRFNTSPGGHPFDLYDNRKDLGNRGVPDGASYKGRGFVQLTGRANYEEFGPKVDEPDLVNQPDRANDPQVAAKILAAFIKSKAAKIRTALADDDFKAARRLVNGGSHGLDEFTTAYKIGRKALG